MTTRALMISTILLAAGVGPAAAQGTQEQGLFRIKNLLETPVRPAAEADAIKQLMLDRIALVAWGLSNTLKQDPRRSYVGFHLETARGVVEIGRRRIPRESKIPARRLDRKRVRLAWRLRKVPGLSAWAERQIAKTYVYEATAQGRAEVHSLFVSSSEPRSGSPGVERVADQVALVIHHRGPKGKVSRSLPIHLSLDELAELETRSSRAGEQARGSELQALIRSLQRQTVPNGATSTLWIHAVHGARVGDEVGTLPTSLLDPNQTLPPLPFGRADALVEERRVARVAAARKRGEQEMREHAALGQALRALEPASAPVAPTDEPRRGVAGVLGSETE